MRRLWIFLISLVIAIALSAVAHAAGIGPTVYPGGPKGAAQYNKSGSFGGNPSVINALSFSPNSSFDVVANACLTAVENAGGGTCDATGVVGTGSPRSVNMNANITVGDGTHAVTLLLPNTIITRASGVQFIMETASHLICAGSSSGVLTTTGGTIINGNDLVAGITTDPNNFVDSMSIEHCRIQSGLASGSVGLALGSSTQSVQHSFVNDILIRNEDIGVTLGGGGCSCYNHFQDLNIGATSYALKSLLGANSNDFDNGTYSAAIGIYDTGVRNVYHKPDIENAATHMWELAGDGAVIEWSYEESSGTDVFDSGAINNVACGEGLSQFADNSGNTSNVYNLCSASLAPVSTRSLEFVTIYSGSGSNAAPSASANAHMRVCVSDAAACLSGTTYVAAGGSTYCEIWSNGTNWLESGSGC